MPFLSVSSRNGWGCGKAGSLMSASTSSEGRRAEAIKVLAWVLTNRATSQLEFCSIDDEAVWPIKASI
jgi:hypothetical protein